MSSAFIILQHLWKFYSQIYKMNCLVGFGVCTWNILSIWCQNYRIFHIQQPNLPNVLLCDLFFFWVTVPNYMRNKKILWMKRNGWTLQFLFQWNGVANLCIQFAQVKFNVSMVRIIVPVCSSLQRIEILLNKIHCKLYSVIVVFWLCETKKKLANIRCSIDFYRTYSSILIKKNQLAFKIQC